VRSPLAALAIVALLLAACSGTPGASTAGSAAPPAGTSATALTICGAASLKSVLEKVRTAYEAANPAVTLTVNTDSSAALETQIEQGAPADVFLSADTTNPQKLIDKGLATGNPVPFAENLLTVIVPAGNPGKLSSPGDLSRTGVKVIAAGDSVPITKYAKQLVDNLAKQPGYPTDFAAGYAKNVVSKEDNVAAIVSKIGLGEGDVAIVYQTDAKTSPKVTAVTIPPDANVVATYAGVVLKNSPNRAAAEAFLTWFGGSGGESILTAAGFMPPT
jgi:molybdate transport system substrate-binding protein